MGNIKAVVGGVAVVLAMVWLVVVVVAGAASIAGCDSEFPAHPPRADCPPDTVFVPSPADTVYSCQQIKIVVVKRDHRFHEVRRDTTECEGGR